MYYLRFRVTTGTAAQNPVLKTVFGRDYVNANGGTTGVIPAFDYAADTNHDGYLNDAEFAKLPPVTTLVSFMSLGSSIPTTARCAS